MTAGWNRVTGLNDDVQPTSSGDVTPNDNPNVWGAWPEIGEQWVQYDWAEPVTIGELGVYFISNLDGAGLGIAVPKSWNAEYWNPDAGDAGDWVPVEASGAYGTEVDAYNVVEFTPVTMQKLRLRLEASGTESGAGSLGIKEWQVYEAPPVDVPDTEAPALTAAVAPSRPRPAGTPGRHGLGDGARQPRRTPLVEVHLGDGDWADTRAVEMTDDGVTRSIPGDGCGGQREPGRAVTVQLDTTAPEVSSEWTSKARKQLALSATDAGSGLAVIEFRVNGGAWSTYSGPIDVKGKDVVQARAKDLAGNVSAVSTITRGK